MKKNELMYTYALDEYKNIINRKNEIRNRAFTFYGFSVPLMTALATLVLKNSNEYSCIKIVMLVLSALLFIVALVLFLLIYMPSDQYTYKPFDIVVDLRNIEADQVLSSYVDSLVASEKYDDETIKRLRREEFDQLAHGFLAERYVEIIEKYESKNSYFKKVFIALSSMIILTLILLMITLLL